MALAGRFAAEDVDSETSWWSDYPRRQFVARTRPQDTYDNFISSVWNKPKRLARSASFTNLTYVKETEHDLPMKRVTRSGSVSSLAPSLALPQYYREAERIVHTTPVYKPHYSDWYSKSYSKSRFEDTLREISRPYKRTTYQPPAYSSYVPYYSNQVKRIYFDQKLAANKSYIRGSQKYLDNYVSARLKADDFAAQYAYSAYEWRRPQDYSFRRPQWGVTVIQALGNPVSFYDKQSLRRLYKMTGRFYF